MKKFQRITGILFAVLLMVSLLPLSASAATKKTTPGKVTLSGISSPAYNKIKISWKKTSNATNYVIYYRKSGTTKLTKLTSVASSKTSFTHTSSANHRIVVGQSYYYTVKAYNSKSKKYGSYNTKGLTTKTLPPTVSLKKATKSGSSPYTDVTISWNRANGCDTYYVYRKCSSNSTYKKIGTIKDICVEDIKKGENYRITDVFYFTDSNPVIGEKNTYTVRAYYSKTKASGNVNRTGVSATVAPTTVSLKSAVLNAKKTAITVSWNKATGGDTYYIYRRCSSNSTYQKIATVKSNVLSYTDNSPVIGEKNTYTVRAYNSKSKASGDVNRTGVSATMPTKVTGITLNKTSATLTEKGETLSLVASVSPSNAADKSITWSSSNTDVATVNNGTVTAVANGTAVITATANDGSSKKASCTVTVKIPDPVVKVSEICFDKTSATFTEKGETLSLTATVSPSNAADRSITWSSSDTKVATVSSNGTVTAIANGTAVITAMANDGSGKQASCTVTVEIPEVQVENISLAGGDGKICSVFYDEIEDNIDLSAITFDIIDNNNVVNISGEGYDENWMIHVSVQALKAGTVQVIAKYNGTILKIWNITITSDWEDYVSYENWKLDVESQIWTSDMTVTQKLTAIKNYIQSNFQYSYSQAAGIPHAPQTGKTDCFGATDIFCDMAKDLGLKVGYVDVPTGTVYEYSSEATSNSTGHMCSAVWLDNQWVMYDASPLPSGAVD